MPQTSPRVLAAVLTDGWKAVCFVFSRHPEKEAELNPVIGGARSWTAPRAGARPSGPRSSLQAISVPGMGMESGARVEMELVIVIPALVITVDALNT